MPYAEFSGTNGYVRVNYTETTDIIANTSVIKVTSVQIMSTNRYQYNFYGEGGIYINGQQVVAMNNTVDYSVRVDAQWTWYTISNSAASTTITVPHNSDGSGSFTLTCKGRSGTSYNDFNVFCLGAVSGNITINGSQSVALVSIDRTAPSIAMSVSNITSDGFTISASSSVSADCWDYSTDGGTTWTRFLSDGATSASVAVSGLATNQTFTVKVRARKITNHVYGTSAASSIKTLGSSVIHNAGDFYADDATTTISYNATVYDSSFYHRLTIRNGNTALLIIDIGQLSTGIKADRTLSLTPSQRSTLLTAMSTVKTLSVSIDLETYLDSSYAPQVGNVSSTACKALTSEVNSAPTFEVFVYADVVTDAVALSGNDQVLIQGVSKANILCTAGDAKNGASITGYSATLGNQSKTSTNLSIIMDPITSYGTLALTVTCIDSRGYSASVTKTVTVLAYSSPKLTSCTLRRKNEIEDLVQLQFSGLRAAIKADADVDTNSIQEVCYRYKATNEEDYCNYVSILSDVTAIGTTFSFSSAELLTLDAEKSYDFQIMIMDKLGSLTAFVHDILLPQGIPLLAARKRNSQYGFQRIGINNPTPTEALDVGGNISMNGAIVQGFVQTISSGLFSSLVKGGIFFYDGSESYDAPTTTPGILEVITDTENVMQRFTSSTSDHTQYTRYYNRSDQTWTAWTQSINVSAILLAAHPIGSYYWSADSTSPETLFGGTWVQVKDRFILAAGDTYKVGGTGGNTSHTHTTAGHALTVAEMPSHSHSKFYVNNGSQSIGAAYAAWPSGADFGGFRYAATNDFTTGATGGGASHSHGNTGSASNMPPYEVAYCWRRTA